MSDLVRRPRVKLAPVFSLPPRVLVLAALAAGCAASAGTSSGSAPAPVGNSSKLKVVSLGGAGKTQGAPAPAQPGKNVPAIKVDTVGYEVGWKKIVIFNIEPRNAVVSDVRSGTLALRIDAARIQARGLDAASKDQVWQVDITDLRKPGT